MEWLRNFEHVAAFDNAVMRRVVRAAAIAWLLGIRMGMENLETTELHRW
jgi:hypothetical protein